MRLLKLVCAIVLCLGIVACSKPESKLVGKWVGKTGNFEFTADKNGVMTLPQVPAAKLSFPYKWSMQGDDVVAMVFAQPINKTIFGKLESKTSLIIEDDKFTKQP